MDIQRLLTGLSQKIIIQFCVVVVAGIALIVLNFDYVYPFYFENQLTNTGIYINSAIMGLLVIGLANILFHLLRYRREEVAIDNERSEPVPDSFEGGLFCWRRGVTDFVCPDCIRFIGLSASLRSLS